MSVQAPGSGSERVDVTLHAENRFLERVDATDLYPAERIAREVSEAVPVQLEARGEHRQIVQHPESGALYVYDVADSTVVTVLPPQEVR
ncbi:hypothetical protein [Haloplanus rubicundus]|uniref:Uncharacterized protein n=1 Tax=Haloplanus rubicundus TaxID=1547898 RepID=A0A345EHJ3_9EURY|nr:hypothetical protein [Haloplanus rubicundus]AXG11665.1 hypothetical protein DU484_18385 [Haloplanus rubicundus]